MNNCNESISLEDNGYLDGNKLFFTIFGKLPSFIVIPGVPPDGFVKWMKAEFGQCITRKFQWERFDVREKTFSNVDSFYVLDNGLMLNIEMSNVKVYYVAEREALARQVANDLGTLSGNLKRSCSISMVYNGFAGLSTTPIEIKRPRLSINSHYNDDLLPVYRKIVKTVRSKKGKGGVVLFGGEPGTGKSTLIRYMIPALKKKVIFITAGMARELDSPSVTNFLLENEGSVFVVEDAEELIASREDGRNSALSLLLNLTDGLIAESLGIYLIASFNTKLNRIDKALVRKGRLLAHYDFRPLSIEKSSNLLHRLGHDATAEGEMTLAQIYHYGDDVGMHEEKKRTRIGFAI